MRSVIFAAPFLVLALYPAATLANTLEDVAADAVEGSFATASLLGDNQVVQLGILDFNPNRVIGTDNDAFGSDDATALRDSIKQYNFPWNYKWGGKSSPLSWHVGARVSYLDVEQEIFLGQRVTEAGDQLSERITTVSAGGGFVYTFDNDWKIDSNLNLSWMRYRNRLDYSTDVAPQVQYLIDGLIVNYDVDMLMLEPSLEASYSWQGDIIDYKFSTSFHYLYGIPIRTDAPAHDVHPSEWFINTGLTMIHPIDWFGVQHQNLKYRVSRIQLSNTLSDQMGASSFYEVEFGWIKKRPDDTEYVREYGIGVNFNFNSVLKGGTLILYLNF